MIFFVNKYLAKSSILPGFRDFDIQTVSDPFINNGSEYYFYIIWNRIQPEHQMRIHSQYIIKYVCSFIYF